MSIHIEGKGSLLSYDTSNYVMIITINLLKCDIPFLMMIIMMMMMMIIAFPECDTSRALTTVHVHF